jgi:aminoglycoside phosphotransferase (APT) family kinase protein
VNIARAGMRIRAPGWLTDLFEPRLVMGVSPLGWGFRNETWKVELADGRRLAVTRLAAAETTDAAEAAEAIVARARLVQPRLVAAGIPAPAVVDLESAAVAGLLVTEFVEGIPGVELFGEEGGAAALGTMVGATWRKLVSVDPASLPLLTISGLGIAERWLTQSERLELSTHVRDASKILADRAPGFVHGDLVPVNIVVRHRSLAALLDLGSVRVADPLLDAAWFDWIVAFHHPAEEAAAWRAFVTSSGLDDQDATTRHLLRILPLVQLVELLNDDRLAAEQADHWIRMLRACLARARCPRRRRARRSP